MQIIRGIRELRRKGLLQLYHDGWQQFGDVVRYQSGPILMHLLTRPEHLQHVLVGRRDNYVKGRLFDAFRLLVGNGLVTSEGAQWRRNRRLLQPVFRERNLAAFVAAVLEETDAMLARWDELADGAAVDVFEQATRLALLTVARTMLEIDLNQDAPHLRDALAACMAGIERRGRAIIKLPLILPTAANRALARNLRIIDRAMREVTNRASSASEHSLIGHLRTVTGAGGMSPRQLQDELKTIFLAGQDTTASALSWTWYALAANPEVQERAREEVQRVIPGALPAYQHVAQLKYLRMVVDETLRMWPPTWILPRELVADDQIDGYHLPRGSFVLLHIIGAHRHPDYWHRPDEFEPERFDAEGGRRNGPRRTSSDRRVGDDRRGAQRAAAGRRESDRRGDDRRGYRNFSYLPFGGGERKCIGMKLALMEVLLCVARVLQRYQLAVMPEHDYSLDSKGTTQPRYGIVLRLRRLGG